MFRGIGYRSIQFLVKAGTDALTDCSDLKQSLLNLSIVSRVEETEDGHLITFTGHEICTDPCFMLWLTDWAHGGRLQIERIVPDVYGCEVTVAEDHVVVNVGHGVMDKITRDEQWRNCFLRRSLSCAGDAVCVQYMNTGHIVVTCLGPDSDVIEWQWELAILSHLIDLLKPFKAALPGTPQSIRDRCISRHRRKPVQNLPSFDSGDCQTDAVIRFVGLHLHKISNSMFAMKMRAMYPDLQITCDRENSNLMLSGEDDVVKKAEDILSYVRSFRKEFIPATDTQALMMMKTEAQNWFQQILDRNEVVCAWKLQQGLTKNRYLTTPFRGRVQLESGISVLGPASDIQQFRHLFQFCLQTAVIFLSTSDVTLLQSDTWKQFLDDQQKPRRGKISPVLKVQQDRISICDVASNVANTLRAVHNFFMAEMGPIQVELESQGNQQRDKKLQTEDITVRTPHGQQQNDDQDRQDTEQQTDVIHTEDKQVQAEVTAEAKTVQTDENTTKTEEKETQTFFKHQCQQEQQTTEPQLQVEDAETQTETQSLDLLDQRAGVGDWPEPDNTREEDTSFTCVKSVVSSEDNRTAHDVSTQPSSDVSDGDNVSSRSSDVSDLSSNEHIVKENTSFTDNVNASPECQSILSAKHRMIEPISLNASDSTPLSDRSSMNRERSSPCSLTLGKERVHTRERLPPRSDSTTFCVQSPPRFQTAHSSPDLVTQYPGYHRGPHAGVAPVPSVLQGHTESGMNNTVPVPPVDVLTGHPPSYGDSAHRSVLSAAADHVWEHNAGMYGQNSRPSSEVDTDSRSCAQDGRHRHDRGRSSMQSTHAVDTPLHDSASLTTHEEHQHHHRSPQASNTTISSSATTGYPNNCIYSNANTFFHLCLDSATLANLSHFEIRYSPTDRERAHEPPVPLETRIINMQHQQDRIMQMLVHGQQQQNDRDANVISVDNPSTMLSASSASSYEMPEQHQRQQQQDEE